MRWRWIAPSLAAAPRRIVANLPYNIATPLIIKWMQQGAAFASLTVMVQKEVADRLIAKPRTKDYGRLSVLAQFLSKPRRLFDLPPRAFVPAPKVTSTVIELLPLPEPAFPARLADLERVTQAAFGQRRKMLRQSLRSLGGDTEALMATAEITPTARAEELTVAQFAALARALEKQRTLSPPQLRHPRRRRSAFAGSAWTLGSTSLRGPSAKRCVEKLVDGQAEPCHDGSRVRVRATSPRAAPSRTPPAPPAGAASGARPAGWRGRAGSLTSRSSLTMM